MSRESFTQTIELPAPAGNMTAAEKIEQTLRMLSDPGADAEPLELMLGTVAMGLESNPGFAEMLASSQDSGELDVFMLALVRWLATLRSDRGPQLLVVEVPRRAIPAGKCVQLMEQAARAMASASSPL